MTPNEKKECIKLLYLDGVISLSEFLALCGYTEEEIRQAARDFADRFCSNPAKPCVRNNRRKLK